MASNRLVTSFVFLTLAFFSVFASPSSSLRDLPSDDKVSLGLYYESLCPYCSNFIVNHLAKIFDNGLIDIVDLKLVPWGNTKLFPNSTISCQHGPAECLLDTIEACAIHAWPKVEEHFAFINCVETLVYNHKVPDWETCFKQLKVDEMVISSCYQSGNGTQLEMQHARETYDLVPPHTYVPWVVVNGKPLYEDYENFASYVCKAYKGSSLPSACGNATLIGAQNPDKRESRVCYLGNETAKAKPPSLLEVSSRGLDASSGERSDSSSV